VATGPQYISLPGYIEIFDGRPDPRCGDNACTPPAGDTIVDAVREAGGSPEDVAVFASWPNIARVAASDTSRIVVSAGRHTVEHQEVLRADPVMGQTLARGASVTAWPGEGDYRPDVWTARLALRYLEVHRPRFMFLGLGDTDEYGHKNDYRGYIDALREVDEVIGRLFATLDAMGERGQRTTVLITTDHGRASNFHDHGPRFPESGRVWLVAAGGAVRARGLVELESERQLADIAPTVRTLLGLHRSDDDRRSVIHELGIESE
jgi:hypothetical protein